MLCAEADKLIYPYLDGELARADRTEIEVHLSECERCRGLVQDESTFKMQLRAKLAPPPAPALLQARIAGALDEVDRGGARPLPLRGRARLAQWAVPGSALVAAAAAIALFVSVQQSGVAPAAIASEAVSAHRRNLPAEVSGSPESATTYLQPYLPVRPRLPHMSPGSVGFRGARVGRIADRDAAQYLFDVSGPEGRRPMTLFVFDPTGLRVTAGESRRRVGDRDVFVAHNRGYTVVTIVRDGVAYVYTSDLSEDELLRVMMSAGE